MPQITYFSDNMGTFWSYVQILTQAISPYIMIAFACVAVGLTLGIIVKAWHTAHEDPKSDDDEDYEIKHY